MFIVLCVNLISRRRSSWNTADAGLPPSSLQLVPVTRIENSVTNGAVWNIMEHMLETLADVSEVVFNQPEEKAGEMEPDGSVLNRHKEEEWLEDMEPYHGARPRTTEFDRPVDEVLGATSGGKEENVKLCDIGVPRLHPEQQIRQEEEVQTAEEVQYREGNHTGTWVTNRGDLGL